MTSAYSQLNQKNHQWLNIPSHSHYHIKSTLVNEKFIRPDDSLDMGFKPSLPDNKSAATIAAPGEWTNDNMPFYKPEGIFSMQIIKPDTTTQYTMLVKRF
jgi:hypothetical protein